MAKKILVITAIASIGTSIAITSPDLASSAPINTTENTINKESKADTAILDWRTAIFNSVEIYGKNINVPGKFDWVQSLGYLSGVGSYFDVNYDQFSVEAVGSPIISNSTNIFVGKTTLTNDSPQEQTLSTNSFSKMISNSITNSTTHGFKFGTKASAKFQIPFVGETGIELSTEYNFSDTSSKTNTESYTYTATPQNIKVPAHTSYEVIVSLDTVKAKGNVKLLSKMSGRDRGNIVYSNPNVAYWYDLTFNQKRL